MKRILSLLLIIGIIFSMNTYSVLAQNTSGWIKFTEDFNDYDGTGLPSGWSWTNKNNATINEASAFVSEDGDTSLKLRTEGSNPAYFGASTPSIDISKGVAKMSFRIYFDKVGNNESNTQLITIYVGSTDSPLMKGIRFVNGVVYYYSCDPDNSATTRFSYSPTENYVYEKEWNTFDVVNDYDNKKVTYYMNGTPIIDKTTGRPVETPTFNLSATSASGFQISARTKHANYSEHGDILVDDIVVSNSSASGVCVPTGNYIKTNPTSIDVLFNNSINPRNFDASEVTVNAYKSDDIMLTNPVPVDFDMEKITRAGCKIVLTEDVELESYDKLIIDFGANTDFTGGDLSSTTLVMVPENQSSAEPVVVYDSESADPATVEVVAESGKVDETDFAYGTKSAKLYETTAGGKVTIGYKDGTTNLFKEGYTYRMTYKMKPLDTFNSKDSSQYNVVGRNYTGSGYLAVRLAVFLRNLNTNNPRIYQSSSSSSVKIGSIYDWNTSASNVTAQQLFDAHKWLNVDMTYYPDLNRFDVTFTNEDGRTVTQTGVSSYFANDSSLSQDKTTEHDGTLKTIQFRLPKNGKLVLDEIKIVETPVVEVSAALKNIVLKDEKGSIVSKNGDCYAPGIKTAEIYFDGDVDTTELEKVVVTGDNVPTYGTEYSQFDNKYTIKFDKLLTGDGAYSIAFPSTLNLAGDITSFDFETSEGSSFVTAADIISTFANSTAVAYVKNTTSDPIDPATLVIVSFKDGAIMDMDAVSINGDSGNYGRIATDSIKKRIEVQVEGKTEPDYENADVVKSFVLNNSTLTHVSDFDIEEYSKPKESTFAYNYSGEADTEYVTAVLMNPDEVDRKESVSLDNLSSEGAFSYADVIKVEDGKFSVGFDINGITGKYTLYVMDLDGNEVLKKEIFCADEEDRKNAQILVNEAVSQNETSAELLDVIDNYAVELGLMDIDLYHDIDKQLVADELYASVKAVAVDVENPTDTQKRVGDICIIDALNNSRTDDIGKYSSMAAIFDNESVKTWYGKDLADSKKITARLLNKSLTKETLCKKLMEALALEIIDEGTGFENVKLLCELLQKQIGINASAGTTAIYRELDGDYFENYAALKAAFNALTDKEPAPAPGGGSGGGGGGFTPPSGPVIYEPTTYEEEKTVEPTPLRDYVFSDIAEYGWAVDSITELYDKNIISGRDEKTFAPGERVLREEFVKMIVEAFAVEGKADVKFEDVSDSDWSKPYILRAYGAGIINGEGNTFGKGKSITRQDMAKIIYETAVKSGLKLETGDISALADYSSIAPYATNAVAALYKSGIINGKGEGVFAPVDYATRAEAAVIISRAMALLK